MAFFDTLFGQPSQEERDAKAREALKDLLRGKASQGPPEPSLGDIAGPGSYVPPPEPPPRPPPQAALPPGAAAGAPTMGMPPPQVPPPDLAVPPMVPPQAPEIPVPQIPPPQTPVAGPGRPQALPQAVGARAAGFAPGSPAAAAPAGVAGPAPGSTAAKIAELERQRDEAMLPPDMKSMEEAYGKRAGAGRNELILSMLAQEARQEPAAAHHLKQAAAAKEPMKMVGGTMTETGFIEDPGFKQEQKVKRIEAQIIQQQRIQQSDADRASKEEAAAKERTLKQELQTERLGVQQQIAALAAGGRGDKASAADARLEDSMSRQFDNQIKNYVVELDATSKLGSIAAGRRPNAIEQQSMIVLLNKFLDPTSVVREGEFNRVAQAQGLVARAQNLYDRVAAGEPMSNQLVNDVRNMSKLYEQAASGKIRQVGDLYSDKARRRNLNPENVVVNPYYQHAGTQPPAAAAPAPAGAPRAAAPAAPAGGATPKVASDADYNALAPGTLFVGPDGKTRRKP